MWKASRRRKSLYRARNPGILAVRETFNLVVSTSRYRCQKAKSIAAYWLSVSALLAGTTVLNGNNSYRKEIGWPVACIDTAMILRAFLYATAVVAAAAAAGTSVVAVSAAGAAAATSAGVPVVAAAG